MPFMEQLIKTILNPQKTRFKAIMEIFTHK